MSDKSQNQKWGGKKEKEERNKIDVNNEKQRVRPANKFMLIGNEKQKRAGQMIRKHWDKVCRHLDAMWCDAKKIHRI